MAGTRCGRCAASLPKALEGQTSCAACRRAPPVFASVAALGDYHASQGLRGWILALKHGGRRDLARPLGAALGVLARGHSPETTLFVPVPLHPLRRWIRGHDQALDLAEEAAAEVRGTLLPCLRRLRWTTPQGRAGSRSRAANVRQAFGPRRGFRAASDRLRGRSIFLVDDVLTSGATASACAAALRRNGSGTVHVLCLARVEERGRLP